MPLLDNHSNSITVVYSLLHSLQVVKDLPSLNEKMKHKSRHLARKGGERRDLRMSEGCFPALREHVVLPGLKIKERILRKQKP